jgi:hypothetical protein
MISYIKVYRFKGDQALVRPKKPGERCIPIMHQIFRGGVKKFNVKQMKIPRQARYLRPPPGLRARRQVAALP